MDSPQLPLARRGLPPVMKLRKVGARILVVEDNAINREVFKAMLSLLGAKLEFATNGAEGVSAASVATRSDLVLMDCAMPVLSGYDATEQIRGWEAAHGVPRIPIVAVTADSFDDARERCIAAGMDDVLTKPLSMGAIKAMLDSHLAAATPGAHAPSDAPSDAPA